MYRYGEILSRRGMRPVFGREQSRLLALTAFPASGESAPNFAGGGTNGLNINNLYTIIRDGYPSAVFFRIVPPPLFDNNFFKK